MTEQLRDVLTRVADRAGPVSVDPLLWARASQTRRRRQRLAGGAAGLVVAVLVSGIVLASGVLHTAPPPVDRPDRQDPIQIEGIAGGGGLRVERDLAVGRASHAIVNDAGAFVVTADDGVAHRLALPGFDAALYVRTDAAGEDLPEVLSLSPDGTKLIYAWSGPLVGVDADGEAKAREGWIESGARLLDLTTGAIDTYPSPTPGPELGGLITQLGRSDWNFRWSPDSRLVTFVEGGGSPGSPTEDWGRYVLDTTKKVTWTRLGPQLNPRPVPELKRDAETTAAALDDAGRVVWSSTPVIGGELRYREQSLMVGMADNIPRPQPLPHDVVWGSGRFSPGGRTLLVEPAGLSDRILAVSPGRAGSARVLLLTGDLPSDQVRTELLGWVGPDQVLAAVHQATSAGRWRADADLALLTLDLDAGTADLSVVGQVDAGDTGSDVSYATDLLPVDISPDDSP